MIHLSMEKENKDPESWSSTHIHQSQWLQTTISDLDEKLDAMMTILEGVNSPNQEHEPCKRREDLLQMLEEFGQSYRVLAISYNQLKSKTSHGSFHPGSLSSTSTSKTICAIEDNLQQVVALVQRNDEKRETIRRLQLEVEALKYENNALQISSRHSNAGSECDQPQIPRSGGRSAGMLFRGCSP